jgi:hypothetical protein
MSKLYIGVDLAKTPDMTVTVRLDRHGVPHERLIKTASENVIKAGIARALAERFCNNLFMEAIREPALQHPEVEAMLKLMPPNPNWFEEVRSEANGG